MEKLSSRELLSISSLRNEDIFPLSSVHILRSQTQQLLSQYPDNLTFQETLQHIDTCQAHIDADTYLIHQSTYTQLKDLRNEYESQNFLSYLRKEVKKDIYTHLHLSENLEENNGVQNFLKGCFDTWVLDNIKLVQLIYE